MTEVVLGLISAITTALAGYLVYKQKRQETEESLRGKFVESLLIRTDKLEERVDSLTQQLIETSAKAEEARTALSAEYEQKIETIRREMKRLLDDQMVEARVWKEKYHQIVSEYQALKETHHDLTLRYQDLESLNRRLEARLQTLDNPS